MEECGKQIKLLSDAPAATDEFGSHKKIAEAIACLVRGGEGGKSISLTGEWGSGKSTVVTLLKEELEVKSETRDILVFTYDSWIHQGDPLRIAFIEELVPFLRQQEWLSTIPGSGLNKSKSQAAIDRLKGSVTDATITRRPVIKWPAFFLSAFILLVPLGAALTDTDTWTLAYGIGVGLLLLPFAWLILYGSYKVCKGKHSEEKPQESSSGGNWKERFLEVLVECLPHESRNEETTTSSTMDPTSIEFREAFKQIMEECLGNFENRKIVLVIDNLDRIDRKEAVEVWANLRVFFDFRKERSGGPESEDWNQRIWCLVPFDRKAIGHLWDENSQVEQSNLAKAFREKTFQADFSVSPPLLSNWKKFFRERFGDLFEEISDDSEFERIYDSFRIYRGSKGVLKPREVKVFLNKLAISRSIWKDRIPLFYQALYLLVFDDSPILSDNGDEKNIPLSLSFADRLTTAKEVLFDSRVIVYITNGQWREYFAAIHYGLDPDDAKEVLLGQQIENALLDGDGGSIKDLFPLNGFHEVFQSRFHDLVPEWCENNPGNLTRAALALESLDEKPDWLASEWDLLGRYVEMVRKWDFPTKAVGVGITKVLKNHRAERVSQIGSAFLKSMSKWKFTAATDKDNEQHIKNWVAATLPVVIYLDHKIDGKVVNECLHLQVDEKSVILALAALREEMGKEIIPKSRVLKYYEPQFDSDTSVGIENIFAGLANDPAEVIWHRNYQYALEVAMVMYPSVNWNATAAPLSEMMWGDHDAKGGSAHFKRVLGSLWTMQKASGDCETYFEVLVHEGHLFHHLWTFKDDETPAGRSLASLIVYTVLQFRAAGKPMNRRGHAQQGMELFDQILNGSKKTVDLPKDTAFIFEEFGEWATLFGAVNDFPDGAYFLKQMLIEVQARQRKKLTPDDLYSGYDELCKLFSEVELLKFVSDLTEKTHITKFILGKSFVDVNPDFISFYMQLVSGKVPKRSQSYLRKGLQSIGKDEWLKEIGSDGARLGLVDSLVDAGVTLDLKDGLYEALRELADQWPRENAIGEEVKTSLRNLVAALSQDKREVLLRDIWDDLERYPDVDVELLLEVFGPKLVQEGILPEDGEGVVRKCFTEMMKKGTDTEILFILDVLKGNPGLLANIPDATRGHFFETVSEKINNGNVNEDIKQRLVKLLKTASQWKINREETL